MILDLDLTSSTEDVCYVALHSVHRLSDITNQSGLPQDSALDWARDHRMHHKYSETDADPHNATRGFFFSHIGWLLVRKHPDLKEKGKGLDLSDLYADPILRFQKK